MPQTFLVTGVSSGLGLDLCRQLVTRGDTVYGTVRKRTNSMNGKDEISDLVAMNPELLKIIEGIDIAEDSVTNLLKERLAGIQFDCIIHNAGSLNGERTEDPDTFGPQKLMNVTMDRMRKVFEVNTLGVLRVHQAIDGQIKEGGKIAIVSTGFASIGDNTSGGVYAYRASKAAVNQIAKSMACDLKNRQISVVAISPGMLTTEFGPGKEALEKFGAKPVTQGTSGILEVLAGLTVENTGQFWKVPMSGEKPEPLVW